jgi:hypothetical protein
MENISTAVGGKMKKGLHFILFYSLLTMTMGTSLFLQASEIYEYEYCNMEPSCGGSFTLGADWLYWRTEESKLEYGAAVTIVNEGDNNLSINSRILQPSFQFENGYRLFAGFTADNDVTICATYNYIPTHTRNNFNSTSMLSMNFATIFNANFPILNALSSNPLNSLNSRWNDTVNYLDLDFSKTFGLCNNFDLVPHLGIRWLWYDQVFKLNGTGVETTLAFNSRLKGTIRGVGLEGGLSATWRLWEGLSLLGNLGGGMLYRRFDNQGILTTTVDAMGSLTIRYKNHLYRGLPMFDALIGVQYLKSFSASVVGLQFGWEQHFIFNTNEFSISGSGNTTMQGLFLGGFVTF